MVPDARWVQGTLWPTSEQTPDSSEGVSSSTTQAPASCGNTASERSQATAGQERLIPLTQGFYAIVDDADYEWLSRFKWHVRKRGLKRYAYGWVGGKQVAMHRLLCRGRVIDHRNGNGLDNRRENLIAGSYWTNNMNYRNRPKGKPEMLRYSVRRLL